MPVVPDPRTGKHQMRLITRQWKHCPQCDNRGFRLKPNFYGDNDIECLNCHHVWSPRPGDIAQAVKKPAKHARSY